MQNDDLSSRQSAPQSASGARTEAEFPPAEPVTGIPFTQYLLPDGRKRQQWIDMPAEIVALAERFIAAGGCYECEVLTTGHVSFTAVLGDDEERDPTVAIQVCSNGPEVPKRVERLVRDSVARLP